MLIHVHVHVWTCQKKNTAKKQTTGPPDLLTLTLRHQQYYSKLMLIMNDYHHDGGEDILKYLNINHITIMISPANYFSSLFHHIWTAAKRSPLAAPWRSSVIPSCTAFWRYITWRSSPDVYDVLGTCITTGWNTNDGFYMMFLFFNDVLIGFWMILYNDV